MATRKSFKDRRSEALAELEQAKQRLAKLETEAAEKIGRLAIKAGLGDLDIPDEELAKEFEALGAKFRQKSAVKPTAGSATSSQS